MKLEIAPEHVLDIIAGVVVSKSGCPDFIAEVSAEGAKPPAIRYCPWCGHGVRIDGKLNVSLYTSTERVDGDLVGKKKLISVG